MPAGMLANYGIEECWGYEAMYVRRVLDFYGLARRGNWGTLEPVTGTTHYVYPEGAGPVQGEETPLKSVGAVEGFEVYENLRAFPRAFLVGQLEVTGDLEAALNAMCKKEYDPAKTIVSEWGPPDPLPHTTSADLGTARVILRTPTKMTVEVEAKEPCYLVVSEAYMPGWKGHVDGRPVTVFPAYYAFRGLIVPQGKHTVACAYEPLSFRFGMIISVLTMVVGNASLGWWLLRSRKRRTSLIPA
jgi:hypothetical protein